MDHEEKLNEVYRQRNALAVAFAKLTIETGGHAGKGIDGEPHPDQRGGWGWVVYADTPAGQVSWHISPDSAHLLDDLPVYRAPWNGTFLARSNDWPLSWKMTPGSGSGPDRRGFWGRIAGQAVGQRLTVESQRNRLEDLLNQLISVIGAPIPDDTALPLSGPDLCAVAADLIQDIKESANARPDL